MAGGGRHTPSERLTLDLLSGTGPVPEHVARDLDPAQVPGWLELIAERERDLRALRSQLVTLARVGPSSTCAKCGADIYSPRARTYCSDACRQAAHRDRSRPGVVTTAPG